MSIEMTLAIKAEDPANDDEEERETDEVEFKLSVLLRSPTRQDSAEARKKGSELKIVGEGGRSRSHHKSHQSTVPLLPCMRQ